jgi:hypothetical protein
MIMGLNEALHKLVVEIIEIQWFKVGSANQRTHVAAKEIDQVSTISARGDRDLPGAMATAKVPPTSLVADAIAALSKTLNAAVSVTNRVRA